MFIFFVLAGVMVTVVGTWVVGLKKRPDVKMEEIGNDLSSVIVHDPVMMTESIKHSIDLESPVTVTAAQPALCEDRTLIYQHTSS